MLVPNAYDLTADWFSNNIPSWNLHLKSRLDTTQVINWLELGSYEGRSSLWTLDNILQHPGSHITCVDIWGESGSNPAETRFDRNMASHPSKSKVTKIKAEAIQALKQMPQTTKFDGCYIDADHDAISVLTQASLVFPMLRVGGILIFDDYELPLDAFNKEDDLPIKEGVDAFLKIWRCKATVLHKAWQVILIKDKE